MRRGLAETLISPAEARIAYGLLPAQLDSDSCELNTQLAENGIAPVDIPLKDADYGRLVLGLAECSAEFPTLMQDTYHVVDHRLDNSAGYVRKDRKVNTAGKQIEDPKTLFHFTETATETWAPRRNSRPKAMQEFMDDGFEIQNILFGVVKAAAQRLETTHRNISKLYTPTNSSTLSFLRVLRYDDYTLATEPGAPVLGSVAKPHLDRGGLTLQAYADAPGFWAYSGGPTENCEHTYYDTPEGQGYLFAGAEHDKIYGKDSHISPLWHGVDRITPPDATYIPHRHAVILFVDAPTVDHKLTMADTLPHLYGQAVSQVA